MIKTHKKGRIARIVTFIIDLFEVFLRRKNRKINKIIKDNQKPPEDMYPLF